MFITFECEPGKFLPKVMVSLLSVQRQQGPIGHMSAWAEEYKAGPSQAQMSHLSLGDSGHRPSAWAAEYLGSAGPAARPSGLGSQWAEQYTNARPQSKQWADEYVSSTAQVPYVPKPTPQYTAIQPAFARSRLSMWKHVPTWNRRTHRHL